MASHSADATTMAQLPDTALVTILQAVPHGDRLRHCAGVSTAWAAAAASATTHVAFDGLHGTRLAAFQAWLDKHAGQLEVVRLRSALGGGAVLQLPCANLARLQTLDLSNFGLHGGDVELVGQAPQAASSSGQGAAMLLPALRAAKLAHVKLSAGSLEVLQQARQLTALEIDYCSTSEATSPSDAHTPEPRAQAAAAVSALLRCLPQLSELRLKSMAMSDDTLAPLSTLAHLQSLKVTANYDASFAADGLLRTLPSAVQLTALHLEPDYQKTMFPAQANNLDGDASAFLATLAQLTRLRSLRLGVVPQATAGLGAFSALTASSHISSISIATDSSAQPLPRGGLQHAFGRSQPQLRELHVGCSDRHSQDPEDWCVDAADLDAVAAACPGLRSLSLQHVLRSEPQTVSSLARLQLTRLELADSTGWLTDEAAATLSQMRGLRELLIWGAPKLTDVGVWHMTALRQLTRLYASAFDCGVSVELLGFDAHLQMGNELELKTPAEAKEPDVWHQLSERMDCSPAVNRLRVQALQGSVDGLRAELAAARGELSRLRARVTAALFEG